MKTASINLADNPTAQFDHFIQLLARKYHLYQIYAFAGKTLSEFTESCFAPAASVQRHHCCLLLITQGHQSYCHEIQDFCNAHYLLGEVTILLHSKVAVDEAVVNNHRFFITVLRHGRLLYHPEDTVLPDDITGCLPPENIEQLETGFQHRLSLAKGFLSAAWVCQEKEQYAICTFLLHQVVEQCCIAMINLFMSYRSDLHHLSRLLRLCRSFSDEPYCHFLTGDKEKKRLFDILVRSYSQARYSNSFTVSANDAGQLCRLVTSFVRITGSLAERRICAVP